VGGWSLPDHHRILYGELDSGGAFTGNLTANVTSRKQHEMDFISGTAAGEVGFGNQPATPPPSPPAARRRRRRASAA
jgi:hypothetical protein